MKNRYILITCSFLLFCGWMHAQDNSFTMEPLNVVKEIEVLPGEHQDFEAHNVFTNLADGEKTYIWERTVQYVPTGWNTAICDLNLCYLPQVSSQDFTVDAGESFDMIPHAYNYGYTGDSVVIQLKVTEKNNPDNTLTSTYTFINMPTANEEVVPEKELSLFPNPTTHNFQLRSDGDIDEVIVYNIIGKPVKQFNAHPNRLYDVGDLQKGMYFVRLLNGDGRVEKTLRLNKE